MRALIERLGPADAVRFLQSFDGGSGDYAKERRVWLDGLSVDEVIAEVERAERK